VKRHAGRAKGPVTYLVLAAMATVVQLACVAQLFADYATSAFA
jgi:hypothetical protein